MTRKEQTELISQELTALNLEKMSLRFHLLRNEVSNEAIQKYIDRIDQIERVIKELKLLYNTIGGMKEEDFKKYRYE